MSFFDQPYYALTKAHVCRIGIWPEQSQYVRNCLFLAMIAVTMTIVVPGCIRLHDAWRDINILARDVTLLLMDIGIFFIVFNCLQYADKITLLSKYVEKHWEMVKTTPAVIILHKYAEKGRYITVVYATCIYVGLMFYFGLCLSPIILDFFDPVNETRPKIYVVEAEYGVDADKYYWFIFAHTYMVATIVVCILVALGAMYILWAVHACALFEMVGFNLELISCEYRTNKENAVTRCSDWSYKKICECIMLHTEAISFANLVESCYYQSCEMALAVMAFSTGISGVQVLINWKNLAMMVQQVAFVIGQLFHLAVISIPGQELMNHSGKIHTTAYNLGWQDMPVNSQKLLIPILMRSNRLCFFTAGKIYVLSMETFGSATRTIISYFMIFAQMI